MTNQKKIFSAKNLKNVSRLAGLIALSFLSIAKLYGENTEMKSALFKLSSDKNAVFKPWKKNEPFAIKYSGFVEDKENPGKQIYKLEVEFNNFCFAILGIPISIPIENDLKTSFTYKTENSKGTTSSLGFLIDFRPGFSGYVDKKSAPKSKKWKTVKIDNIYEVCTKTGMPVISEKYYKDAKPENFTAYLSHIALFLKGVKGAKLTMYFKEIEILGTAPSKEEMKKLAAERWKPAKDKLDKKITVWQEELKTIQTKLENEKLQSKEANAAKGKVLKEIAKLNAKLSGLKQTSYIRVSGEEAIISKLKEFNSIDLKSIDKYLENNKGSFIPYVVNPISDEKILPNDVYINGKCGNAISINATPGEFEPASFVIQATEPIKDVKILATDLKCEKNNGIIPASDIDIKLVKCWYQAGTAWKLTNQQRDKKVMVPELLLKDNSLVKVDTKTEENYLKLALPDGEKYDWISDPFEQVEGKDSFKIMANKDFPVKDSSTLLPFDIPANKNQQVWITVKVPENAKAGIYKGKIELLQGEKSIGKFKLEANVWPFKLPQKPCYTSSIYYRARLSNKHPNGTISSEYKNKEQLKSELKNMLDHGVSNPMCYQSFRNKKLLNEHLGARKDVGINSPDLYYCYGLDVECGKSQESQEKLAARIKEAMDFFKNFGINEVYFYGRDEAKGKKLMAQRRSWDVIHKTGGKVFVAGTINENFEKMGDIQDLLICAGNPSKAEAAKWHSNNHKIWCYANPQGGVENPGVYRRNYGLRLWQNDYDGAATFAYHSSYGNIWNDFDGHYRDENLTYPTVDGVIDTIAWEGYREAIDDARYITALEDEIKKAQKENVKEKAIDNAEKYLAELKTADINKIDLNEMRLKIAEHIMDLRK